MSNINVIKNESAPEGYILILEKTLEDLKDFEIWKDWKNGFISLDDLNKSNSQDK